MLGYIAVRCRFRVLGAISWNFGGIRGVFTEGRLGDWLLVIRWYFILYMAMLWYNLLHVGFLCAMNAKTRYALHYYFDFSIYTLGM